MIKILTKKERKSKKFEKIKPYCKTSKRFF